MMTTPEDSHLLLFKGGTILTGRPGEVLREPVLLVEGPTISFIGVAAEALGIQEKTGTLEEGKWADILVIEGDPPQGYWSSTE